MNALIKARNIIFSVFLMVTFCLIAFIETVPMIAELKYIAAQKRVADFRWKEADGLFRAAIKFDPLSSQYAIGYTKFLIRSSINCYDEREMLIDAERYCNDAIYLEPGNAEFYAMRAIIKIRMKRPIADIFSDFRKARDNDPNGYDVAYFIGFNGVTLWKDLNTDDRALVRDRLSYFYRKFPHLCRDVYPLTWYSSKDFSLLQAITPDELKYQKRLYDFIIDHGLWQFRKQQKATIDQLDIKESRTDPIAKIKFIKEQLLAPQNISNADLWKKVDGKWVADKKAESALTANNTVMERRSQGLVSRADWVSLSADNKKLIFNKNYLTSNTISYALVSSLQDGRYKVSIEMKGAKLKGRWPYTTIEIDGELIGETLVGSSEFTVHTFEFDTKKGDKLIGISLVNFAADKKNKGKSRTLTLGNAKLEKMF